MQAAAAEPHMSTNGTTPPESSGQPLLVVNDLRKHFPLKRGLFDRRRQVVQAVDALNFEVMRGGTLGIVGESGCGKSTTARLLLHLIEPDRGDIVYDGRPVGRTGGIPVRELYRHVQMVFQD